ncbi:hypothetical protein DTO013E5_4015 [Penicillium roqueforti]|uniref:DUF1279 domain-containing protein n=1 Tax=Penicillium roqueforti (strain FM164) TaxID=1365484 RepID=W6QEP5_PENRF|nr:uncharacterized protein LCP9604111_1554 [Penicillium roqueforti]CDM28057.1 Domain of unknown function DUF1279 [Penicillium roqueforti FM164]KAF9251558.1 hypothetical protein LCP9604111_1554 [Penicillium roqueforti]KAI2685233.1 hypothetical protein LCP963914a_4560 [Penicillium roqueforti]KAI2690425.1 hypothetical protein CBS147355_876 [Penicillium roqueforti]KAI2695605.1 hypothetical protein CBS147372_9022 [Penicillium roqueforti]
MSVRPTLLAKWISRPSSMLKSSPSLASHLQLHLNPSIRPSLARRSTIFPHAHGAQVTARFSTRTRPTPTPSSFQPKPKQRRFNSGSAGDGKNSSSGSDSGPGNGTGSRGGGKTKPKPSLSQRLKSLSREYGWAALGVYLGLSALDFPFCFAAVRLLGVDRIGYYEHVVIGYVKDKVKSVFPKTKGSEEEDGQGQLAQAEERNQEEASIWTQLVFAYAIHKSFIFIRVPLTAAVTPKVVKTLRRWGWDIGKRKPKST